MAGGLCYSGSALTIDNEIEKSKVGKNCLRGTCERLAPRLLYIINNKKFSLNFLKTEEQLVTPPIRYNGRSSPNSINFLQVPCYHNLLLFGPRQYGKQRGEQTQDKHDFFTAVKKI